MVLKFLDHDISINFVYKILVIFIDTQGSLPRIFFSPDINRLLLYDLRTTFLGTIESIFSKLNMEIELDAQTYMEVSFFE